MSDGRLRELQRRAKETGAPADEASWLVERIRANDLDRRRLGLAAFCERAAAVAAVESLGDEPLTLEHFLTDPAFEVNPHGLDLSDDSLATQTLIASLATWGWEPLLRAALAAASLQIQRRGGVAFAELHGEAVRATGALLRAPGRAMQEQALAVAGKLEAQLDDFAEDSPEAVRAWRDLGAPWFCVEAAGQDWRFTDRDTGTCPGDSSTWRARNAVWPMRAAEAAADWTSHADLQAAIHRELAEWALGDAPSAAPDLSSREGDYPSVLEWRALRD